MIFAPVIPAAGIGGYQFLHRTRPQQQAAFDAQPAIQRRVEDFATRIVRIEKPEDLVADRVLREVALGAFGLDEDIDSRYLIEQVLGSNTRDPGSLVNRFSDKRYFALARAFGFGDIGGPRTQDTGFADRITELYRDRQFEIASGNVDPDMRLALGLDRDLGDIVSRAGLSQDAQWFTVMATPPVRKVFEVALNLPASFGTLDIDRQLSEFKTRAQKAFGTSDLVELNLPESRDAIRTRFLALSQLATFGTAQRSSASIALTLLQSV